MALMIAVMLAAWLALTLARQLGQIPWRWAQRIARTIQRYDPFHFVPSFCFFAPSPPSLDFELLYRDKLADGGMTAWRALRLFSSSSWRPVWNPEKRRAQAAFRMCSTLVRDVRFQVAARRHFEELYRSGAYIAIAHYVAAAPHTLATDQSQFLIAVSPGFEEKKEAAIAFMSPFFRL